MIDTVGSYLGVADAPARSFRETVTAAGELERQTQALAEANIELVVTLAELRAEQREALLLAADQTASDEERLSALEDARQATVDLFAAQREQLQQEFANAQAIANNASSTREERQAVADIEAQLVNLRSMEASQLREIEGQLTGFTRRLQEQAAARREATLAEADALRISTQSGQNALAISELQIEIAEGTADQYELDLLRIQQLQEQIDVEEDRIEVTRLLVQQIQISTNARIRGIREEMQAQQEQMELEERIAASRDTIRDARISNIGAIGDALTTLAGDSKGLAIAGLLIEQGAAVASTIVQGQVAATSALAPPPIGLGPVAGMPLAASIQTSTAVSVGSIIAATLAGITSISSAPGPAASGIAGGGGTSGIAFGPTVNVPNVAPAMVTTGTSGVNLAVVSDGSLDNADERRARVRNLRKLSRT